MKLSMKTALSFFAKGNWLSKVLTITLTAVSFAFFALSSMGYARSKVEYLTNAYRDYLRLAPYLGFCSTSYKGVNEYRSMIRGEMGVDFLASIGGVIFDPFNFISTYDYEDAENLELFNFYIGELRSNVTIISGTEEQYRDMGYPLLAGHYPEAESETVIPKTLFEAFRDFGYSDNSANFVDHGTDKHHFRFDVDLDWAERQEISAYEDILGKNLRATYFEGLLDFTIVGVYDNSLAKKRDELLNEGNIPRLGNATLLLSEKFEEKYCDTVDKINIKILFAPVTEEMKRRSFAKRVVMISDKLFNLECEEAGVDLAINHGEIGAFSYYFNEDDMVRLDELMSGRGRTPIKVFYSRIFIPVGFVMLVIAVILNISLITDVLYRHRRQIGALRAIGYRKRQVMKIVLLSVMILAAMIFVVSLILTTSLYFGWFKTRVTFWSSVGEGILGRTMYVFNIWTVLILLGISIAVPVLSAIVPILLFFRKPIAENLKRRE